MNKTCDLSIILACYNEMEILYQSVDKIVNALDNLKLNYEIIMIDDCSKDGTREELTKIEKKYPKVKTYLHEKNLGRGGTVTQGLQIAKGNVVGYLDIDLETPEWYIAPAYLLIKQGADFVLGYRIHKFELRIFIRTILSRGYNFLTRTLLKIPFKDTEAGFKFFKKEKIMPILKQTKDNGWFWDTEITARAYYSNLKIKPLPTLFIRKPYKTSTVNIFRDSLEYFRKLLKFRRESKELIRNIQN